MCSWSVVEMWGRRGLTVAFPVATVPALRVRRLIRVIALWKDGNSERLATLVEVCDLKRIIISHLTFANSVWKCNELPFYSWPQRGEMFIASARVIDQRSVGTQ